MARNQLFNGISDFFGDIGRARRAAATFEELNQLTDEGLARRGLNRTELANRAYTSGFGRK